MSLLPRILTSPHKVKSCLQEARSEEAEEKRGAKIRVLEAGCNAGRKRWRLRFGEVLGQ